MRISRDLIRTDVALFSECIGLYSPVEFGIPQPCLTFLPEPGGDLANRTLGVQKVVTCYLRS